VNLFTISNTVLVAARPNWFS